MKPTAHDLRRRSIAVRLGFRGYRVFLCSPPVFQKVPPGSSHMLHYHDYDLKACDYIAEQLGFFPDAREIGLYDLEKWLAKRDGTKYRLAFVNNGEYELRYMDPLYERYQERRSRAK